MGKVLGQNILVDETSEALQEDLFLEGKPTQTNETEQGLSDTSFSYASKQQNTDTGKELSTTQHIAQGLPVDQALAKIKLDRNSFHNRPTSSQTIITKAETSDEPYTATMLDGLISWLAELFRKLEKPESTNRFYAEFAALVHARANLDEPSKYEKGRAELKELAELGNYTNISSAITLAKIAETDTEKNEVVSLLEALKSKYPEQGSLIDAELKRF